MSVDDLNLPGEIWKPIPGYYLYEASTLGRIRSWRKSGAALRYSGGIPKRSASPKIISIFPMIDGYMRVSLQRCAKCSQQFAHRIIALAFLGPIEVGMQVNHKDGNKKNNAPENLEYCTQSENIRHAYRTGLIRDKRGDDHHNTILSELDLCLLRVELAFGKKKQGQLAKEYGIAESTLSAIKHGTKRKGNKNAQT